MEQFLSICSQRKLPACPQLARAGSLPRPGGTGLWPAAGVEKSRLPAAVLGRWAVQAGRAGPPGRRLPQRPTPRSGWPGFGLPAGWPARLEGARRVGEWGLEEGHCLRGLVGGSAAGGAAEASWGQRLRASSCTGKSAQDQGARPACILCPSRGDSPPSRAPPNPALLQWSPGLGGGRLQPLPASCEQMPIRCHLRAARSSCTSVGRRLHPWLQGA